MISPSDQPPFFDGEAWVWDRWEENALARGLDPNLAMFGRMVMRENLHHAWPCPEIARLCREPLMSKWPLFPRGGLAGRGGEAEGNSYQRLLIKLSNR